MSSPAPQSFSQRLRDRRYKKGMTQDALARAIGVSVLTVGNWENGSRIPRDYNLFRIAQLFGVSEDWLIEPAAIVVEREVAAQSRGKLGGKREKAADAAALTSEQRTEREIAHGNDLVPVRINIDIDRGIAPLVVAFNTFPDVRTYASCSGHPWSQYERRAYVGVGVVDERDGQSWQRLRERLQSIIEGFPEANASLELMNSWAYLHLESNTVEEFARRVLEEWQR